MQRLGFISGRLRNRLGAIGTNVTLQWLDLAGGVLDPVSGAMVGATETVLTSGVAGLVHFAPATSALRQNVEVEAGDVIVDFAPDVDLDSKPGLRFSIDGQVYEPKAVGDKLVKAWDVVVKGQRLARSVLLKKAL